MRGRPRCSRAAVETEVGAAVPGGGALSPAEIWRGRRNRTVAPASQDTATPASHCCLARGNVEAAGADRRMLETRDAVARGLLVRR